MPAPSYSPQRQSAGRSSSASQSRPVAKPHRQPVTPLLNPANQARYPPPTRYGSRHRARAISRWRSRAGTGVCRALISCRCNPHRIVPLAIRVPSCNPPMHRVSRPVETRPRNATTAGNGLSAGSLHEDAYSPHSPRAP